MPCSAHTARGAGRPWPRSSWCRARVCAGAPPGGDVSAGRRGAPVDRAANGVDDRCWPEAIRCAGRLVAHVSMREESHRLLMRRYQHSGDRARAVGAYHVRAAVLERELGIEPPPDTRALFLRHEGHEDVPGGRRARRTKVSCRLLTAPTGCGSTGRFTAWGRGFRRRRGSVTGC
ncbi:bacterial transcriptional activator domain-containing protein [Streptomyces bullii]|uniref:Bacterial transcriptional activator domain-containing protein n=1 Tax=Streptomyces bullii TaxID=349910 RepID=A0ABW0UXP5_9ACTN